MAGAGLMAIGVMLQLPMPLLTMYIFDHVLPDRRLHQLHIIGLVLLAFLVLKSASAHLQTRVLTTFRNRVMYDLRRWLFDHVERLPLGFFNRTRVGYLVSRITTDENLVRGLMATDMLTLIREVLTLLAGIALVFWLNWKLALLSITVVPFYAFWITRWNPKVRSQTREMNENYSAAGADMIETFTGIYTVKAFVAEGAELMKMLRSFSKALKSEFRLVITMNILTIGAVLISSFGRVSLIWFGCSEIIRGDLTIGGFLAFNSFLQYLYEPTQNLLNLNASMQQSLTALDRIYELVDEPPEENHPKAPPISVPRGVVEFRKVGFSYDGRQKVLNNINLRAEPGMTVAIVGKSGAGKTTLVNLLMRYYRPTEGAILIDNEDVADVTIESLRRSIAVVPQHPYLFADTIWNNLRYAAPEAGEEEIIASAKLANAHDFILGLPNGYDTRLGEHGKTLSGGERQRLSIAMAFLKNSPILVLDEATSSVDSMAEREIRQAVERLAARRTTFVIAHRLTTVRNADLIAVIDKGRMVELGRHDDLILAGGPYTQLYSDYFQRSGASALA